MPTGIIINALSVALGGAIGGLFGNKVNEKIKTELAQIFGVCAMGMGISSVVLMKNMPAVIFSVIVGTAIGLMMNFGIWVNKGAMEMQKPVTRLFKNQTSSMPQEEYIRNLVTVIVVFCASATGIYGSLDSGISGDHTILISKSILDFFSAIVFACNLGMVVSFISIPQCLIFLVIFFLAGYIDPLTTPDMIADFKACGGILLLATGFRMAGIKNFPTADMIPAMVIVMPVSWLWTNCVIPFL